jgi:hypothetical protein
VKSVIYIYVNKQKCHVPLIHKRREETGSKVGNISDVSEPHIATTFMLIVGKLESFLFVLHPRSLF